MDAKKWEQLVDLVINENEEAARDLFHEIVVEKSREIYESYMMDDSMMDEDMMSEVDADEMAMEDDMDDIGDDIAGIEDDEMGAEDDMMDMDADAEDFDDAEADLDGEEGDLEDRVVDLEDKLDELMAEFEAMMGDKDSDMDDDEGEEMMEASDDEDMMEAKHDDDDEDETLEESVSLNPVKGLYGSNIGGDNGVQTKSPALTKPKVVSTGASAVKFSGGAEEKGRSAPQAKNMDGSGNFKNTPGKDNFRNDGKGESVKKPAAAQAPGNKQSVVAKK